jgi:hypothetical protein
MMSAVPWEQDGGEGTLHKCGFALVCVLCISFGATEARLYMRHGKSDISMLTQVTTRESTPKPPP